MYNDALCQLRLLRSLARQGLSSQHLDACNIRACTSSAAASAKRHDLSQGALLGRKAPTAELHLHRSSRGSSQHLWHVAELGIPRFCPWFPGDQGIGEVKARQACSQRRCDEFTV